VWHFCSAAVVRYALHLVAKKQTSDVSFEELAMPLFDSLYNLAAWLSGNTGDAEDLVQETYLKALRGYASFQPGTNFRAWIFRILRNTFLTSRAGLAATRTLALEDEDEQAAPATLDTPESILLGKVDRQAIQAALEKLPVHFREVLLLCDAEEMSYQEISETLSIPMGTVMSRIYRARRALREALQAQQPSAQRTSHG